MPLFEYKCLECDHIFEDLATQVQSAPVCPNCSSRKTEKLISMPGPLKRNPFPFKISPPRQTRMGMSGSAFGCGVNCAKNK